MGSIDEDQVLQADVGDLGPIYVSDLEQIKKAKELKFPFDSAFGMYKAFFAKGSVAHPAKMSTHLTEYLIKHYTREGDTVVDPFGGIGTTGVVGAINNRNVVLNELEPKFVGYINETKQRVEGEGAHGLRGKITVFQGDSRKLSDILSQNSDAVITSAPYARTEGGDKGINVKGIVTADGKKGRLGKSHPKRLSEDPNNIDNLPYVESPKEKVDGAVMSPPYSDTVGKTGGEYPESITEGTYGESLKNMRGYSQDPKNIGNLKHGSVDGAITSPPYSEAQMMQDKQWMIDHRDELSQRSPSRHGAHQRANKYHDKLEPYAASPENLGNLKHGDIDAVVTSPPYENTPVSAQGAGENQEWNDAYRKAQETGDFTEFRALMKKQNREAGYEEPKIDGAITSPPYEEMGQGTANKIASDKQLPVNYDAAVTSPPYEESQNPNRRGGINNHPDDCKCNYCKKNRGNAGEVQGYVDASITSPPYENTGLEGGDTEARRERLIKAGFDADYYLGGNARNTGLKKYDAVITSPMYEDDRGTRKDDPVRSKNGRNTIGTIDGAIASPPYEDSTSADNPNVEKYRKGGEFPIEAAITSPPYEDSMGEARHASPNTQSSEWIQKQRELTQYPNGKSPDQIGNLKKESYLEAVFKVYQETFKVVKPGGIVCVVVKPFQRQGQIIDLPLQTWKLLERCGFELHDVLKMKLNALSFWRILHYQKNKVIPRLWHEYIVVVRKPEIVLDSFSR